MLNAQEGSHERDPDERQPGSGYALDEGADGDGDEGDQKLGEIQPVTPIPLA
jgi:hypothetical protein